MFSPNNRKPGKVWDQDCMCVYVQVLGCVYVCPSAGVPDASHSLCLSLALAFLLLTSACML